jgi:glutamate/tyrosine decarboxylase-like PLP-dependent enzyme
VVALGQHPSMSTPPAPSLRDVIDPSDTGAVIDAVVAAARGYLAELDSLPAKEPGAVAAAAFTQRLPESGMGAEVAVRWLADYVRRGGVNVDGPRFFHLVAGGATPAALGGDLLCSVFDQHAFASMSSPAAVRLEQAMIEWLKDLFNLPSELTGTLVTGGTMANFTALAAARQWCARRGGVDAAQSGLRGAQPITILSSGFVHASISKVASMLGIGRENVRTFASDASGRVDLQALEHALQRLDGQPSILVANAGEVNAGEFDPIDAMADLADAYGSWLHVDGTFGLFARVRNERTRSQPMATSGSTFRSTAGSVLSGTTSCSRKCLRSTTST